MEESDHPPQRGVGGGGGLAYSKNYPFCMYLGLKSSEQLSHKPTLVVIPKVMHKNIHVYPKNIHLSEFFLEPNKNRPSLCLFKNITPDPYPLCGSFHAGVGWSETILVTCFPYQRNLAD